MSCLILIITFRFTCGKKELFTMSKVAKICPWLYFFFPFYLLLAAQNVESSHVLTKNRFSLSLANLDLSQTFEKSDINKSKN